MPHTIALVISQPNWSSCISRPTVSTATIQFQGLCTWHGEDRTFMTHLMPTAHIKLVEVSTPLLIGSGAYVAYNRHQRLRYRKSTV
jgi:hypothetical protein